MHNSVKINRIIKQAESEIEIAAKAIFNKYNAALIKAIQAQLYPNEKLYTGMGAAVIEKDGTNMATNTGDDPEMVGLIQSLLYPMELESGFEIPSVIGRDWIDQE